MLDGATAAADRLEAPDTQALNAVTAYDREILLAGARALEHAPPGPLTGLTVAVKDNICTLDYPTTCGSRVLEGYRSPFEATAVSRLKRAGALVACKANLDEFGMGSSTEWSAIGRTRHPIDPERVPGGSSGGPAALVAKGVVEAGLGSDTGGSVRQPAAFCGIVGAKPSYGSVSRFGLVAFASSLDQIGVLAPSVTVARRVHAAIGGPDPHDATSVDRPPPTAHGEHVELAQVRLGVPVEYWEQMLDAGVRRAVDACLGIMRARGANVADVSLPHTPLATPAYYVISSAEASSNLARFDGVRFGQRRGDGLDLARMYRETRGEGFGPEVRRRIITGTFVLSAGYRGRYYQRAAEVRQRIAQDFRRVFQEVDFVVTPTTPSPAFRAGERLGDPVAMYSSDRLVCAVNLAGLPAISIPAGRVSGLPVGVQLIGRPFADAAMYDVATVLEDALAEAGEFA